MQRKIILHTNIFEGEYNLYIVPDWEALQEGRKNKVRKEKRDKGVKEEKKEEKEKNRLTLKKVNWGAKNYLLSGAYSGFCSGGGIKSIFTPRGARFRFRAKREKKFWGPPPPRASFVPPINIIMINTLGKTHI